MSLPDLINAGFETVAGVAVLNHCWTLHQDKQVRGVSVASTALFFLWGLWNLYYYPHLDQFWSFAGGVFITLANLLYVGMLLQYREVRP
jgi:hypothetical protein